MTFDANVENIYKKSSVLKREINKIKKKRDILLYVMIVLSKKKIVFS